MKYLHRVICIFLQKEGENNLTPQKKHLGEL